ncbi:hypothetical protein M0R45_032844 [Rubus argutus]|uniref:Uncharacterized protein n=1 Tax=Rubus argutus TaxID=59490 RepID=A0AAW1WLH1_RUBAR
METPFPSLTLSSSRPDLTTRFSLFRGLTRENQREIDSQFRRDFREPVLITSKGPPKARADNEFWLTFRIGKLAVKIREVGGRRRRRQES